MNATRIILLALWLGTLIGGIYIHWRQARTDKTNRKPKMTNGDVMRYSDNRTLALWLECPVCTGLAEIACDRSAIPYVEKDCHKCIYDWLNREVEETE